MLDMIKETPRFVEVFVPLQIDSVMQDSPAAKVGLKKGDRILNVNGKKVDSYNELTEELGRVDDVLSVAQTPKDSLKALTGTLTVLRAGVGDKNSASRYPQLGSTV